MELPEKVLRAAVCGVLIVERWPEKAARDVLEPSFDLTTAHHEIRAAVVKVGSVALTLQAHGMMKDSVQ